MYPFPACLCEEAIIQFFFSSTKVNLQEHTKSLVTIIKNFIRTYIPLTCGDDPCEWPLLLDEP